MSSTPIFKSAESHTPFLCSLKRKTLQNNHQKLKIECTFIFRNFLSLYSAHHQPQPHRLRAQNSPTDLLFLYLILMWGVTHGILNISLKSFFKRYKKKYLKVYYTNSYGIWEMFYDSLQILCEYLHCLKGFIFIWPIQELDYGIVWTFCFRWPTFYWTLL